MEINSKTGLYPLYVATSRYYQEYEKQRQATAGNVSLENKRMIWQQILRENIFCVAKTPMAKAIAKRTLIGYQDYDVNIEFINDIVEDAKQDVEKKANKIKEVFGNLKFDVVIGNPPYQDETHGDQDNYSAPVYNEFMDLSYKLSNLVTLITPGRFLFGAGSTPKAWTTKMLNNNHFCVVRYEQVSSRIFPKTDIKGGIVISLYDTQKDFGSIADNFSPAGIFIAYRPLINIMKKVTARNFRSFSDLIYGRNIYRFTDDMHHDHPNIINKLSKGHAYDLSSNVFKRVPELFLSKKPNDNKDKYLGILGRDNNQRVIKYIDKRYIKNVENLDKYKVFVPKANGTGALGEVLSTPLIGEPLIGSTETFISIGAFNTKEEAKNTMSYIRTKFARTMLGILKITQDNTAKTWKLVPMQDFTANSDIDWTKSISEIDQQLYRKYNLSQDEIDFIETKVQVME